MLKVLRIILFALLLLFTFSLFSVKVWDPDFWWHLKTGEYIYQMKSLPETDPFSYTSLPKDPNNPESKRMKFTLTQYWLAQLIFFWIYQIFNFQGIIYMRASILTMLVFLLYKGVRREGIGTNLSIGLLIPAVVIFYYGFTGERPQLFSFLFAFLLVYLLEGFRRNSFSFYSQVQRLKPAYICYLFFIPIMMFIWANLHGGFILGIIIILAYLFSEWIKLITKRLGQPLPLSSLKSLTIVSIISILSSLINPNGYDVVSVLIELKKSFYVTQIIETVSPVTLIRSIISSGYDGSKPITYLFIAYFILLSLSLLVFLVNIKRLDLTDVMIVVGLTALSLEETRFIAFSTPIATFFVARYGAKTIKRLPHIESLNTIRRKAEVLFYILISITLIFILIRGGLFKSGVKSSMYPEGAVMFLKENRLSENMFNPYKWGGYLIWRLYPNYKVFTDGRGLIEEIFVQEEKIMKAYARDFRGIPEWKALLKAYGINFIITYSVDNFSGRLVPLVPALLKDPEWHLVYMDTNSLIFLRNSPENRELINRFGIQKERIWNELIMRPQDRDLWRK